jgi:hypothetical protein
MKPYLLLLIITFSLSIQAQQKKLSFTYDDAGNQIKRELTLSTNKKVDAPTKEIAAITEEELEKFFPEDVISYYPNPVREELFLKWELTNDVFVKGLQVYNFNGQILKSYSQSERGNTQTIPFQGYPSGVYLIILEYNNGDQKTIKIIKQ